MKTVSTLILILSSVQVLAGNSVGTMRTTNGQVIRGGSVGTIKSLEDLAKGNGGGTLSRPQIIFNMGQKDGLVRYAHGQLQNGEWAISEIVDSVDSVIQNSEFVKALTESQVKQDWVELK